MAVVLNEYIADFGQGYNANHRSEAWTVKLEIPWDAWTDGGPAAMPTRGAVPPSGDAAFPADYSIPAASTLLESSIRYRDKQGHVVVYLVYGYSITSLGVNKAYVTTRTILTSKRLTHARDASGKLETIIGPKDAAAGAAITNFYDILPEGGYPYTDEDAYQLIRLHALLNATGMNTYIGALIPYARGLNSVEWTLLGNPIPTKGAMYRGAVTDLYRYSSPGNQLWIAHIDFLVHPYVWPDTVKRVEYKKVAVEVDLVNAAGTVIGERTVMGRKLIDPKDSTAYTLRKTYDFATLLNVLLQ